MKKNSKPPEERRRELVDTASRLFSERGYETVSVRDILDAVGGAPGMFYCLLYAFFRLLTFCCIRKGLPLVPNFHLAF